MIIKNKEENESAVLSDCYILERNTGKTAEGRMAHSNDAPEIVEMRHTVVSLLQCLHRRRVLVRKKGHWKQEPSKHYSRVFSANLSFTRWQGWLCSYSSFFILESALWFIKVNISKYTVTVLIELSACASLDGWLPFPIFSLCCKPLTIHLIWSSLKELKNVLRKHWIFFLESKA